MEGGEGRGMWWDLGDGCSMIWMDFIVCTGIMGSEKK